jgi:predicted secreted protein
MANEIAGFKAVFGFSSASGGTINELGSLRNFGISATHTPVDVTTFDSSGHRDFVAGWENWTGTAETLHVQTSTRHKDLADLMIARTKFDMQFYPTGSSSDGYYSGSAFFTDFGVNAPMEDALAGNIGFQGTGTLARAGSSS